MGPRVKARLKREAKERFETDLRHLIKQHTDLEHFEKAYLLYRAMDDQIFEYGYSEGYRCAEKDYLAKQEKAA